ncbi:retrotransposon protein, putative, ty1-copia subclass [Tanacetum coccineum]
MVRSMMNLTTLPLSFWDYALETATRILNMIPTKNVDKTLYELWYGKVPNLSYLKVWGCGALVKRDTPDKLQQRSVKCIFIGYPKEMMGYYFYFPPENKIIVARYAEFLEKNILSQEVSGRAKELKEIQDKDTSPFKNTSEIPMEVEGFEPPQDEVVPVRRSTMIHRAPDRLCLNVTDISKMDKNEAKKDKTKHEIGRAYNEVLEDIENKDSYVSNLDEPASLVTPLSDANEDECFDPGGDIDEIVAFLEIDVSTDIEDGYHDSGGDIIYLESLLFNDTILNLPPKVFLDHDPRSLRDEPDNDDWKSMVKVFDPGIHEKIISLTYMRLPFEDRHYFSLTFVIKTFLPFLTYLVNYLLLTSESEATIFDRDVSAYSFYSLEPVAYESPMMIFPFFCFYPKDKGIRGESS